MKYFYEIFFKKSIIFEFFLNLESVFLKNYYNEFIIYDNWIFNIFVMK